MFQRVLTIYRRLKHTNCGGNYIVLDNGWKDCSNCLIPRYNYDYIINKLIELHEHKNGGMYHDR